MKKLATLVTKTRAAGDATPLVAARNPPTKICGNGKRDAQTAMGRCPDCDGPVRGAHVANELLQTCTNRHGE